MYLRIFRILLYTTALLAIFLGIERLCHLATDGFSVFKITHDLPQITTQETPNALIDTILSQKFTYLDSGAQSYVFVSEDSQYVIKFFKFQHMRIPPWISYLPLPKSLDNYRNLKITKKNLIISKLLLSYNVAYDLFQKETGLIYLHLNKTKRPLPLHLIDKIGIHYFLEGSNLAFVIQHKGTLLYEVLDQDMKKGEIQHAKDIISSLLNLSILRCQKGIGDQDPDFRTNFGLIDNKIVQLDTGRFYLDEKEKNPEIYKNELYRITRNFRTWLSKNHPELISYLDTSIERIKGDDLF